MVEIYSRLLGGIELILMTINLHQITCKPSTYPSSLGTISLVRDSSILLGFTLKTASHFAIRAFWTLMMFAAGIVLVRSRVQASDCSLRSAGGSTMML